MPDRRNGEHVQELIPEVAMGVASGEVRARALAHVARCPECRRELEQAAATVDDLLLLAPEHEPPAGFDTKVLQAAWAPRRRRMGRVSVLVAAALVVAAVAGGLTWWQGADDRETAGHYRDTLAVADGRDLTAAALTVDGAQVGHVFAYEGSTPWVFVNVDGGPSGRHEVRLVTTDGQVHWIGTCTVRDGRGSWGVAIDVPVSTIDRIELPVAGGASMVAQLS